MSASIQSLVDLLGDSERREAIVRDTVALIEREVAGKSGLRGAAIKAGFKAMKAIRPGMVQAAVERLLPAFAPAVDPFFRDAVESGDIPAFFKSNADAIAEALLAVTDEKAKKAERGVLLKIYNSLRGQAKQHTAAAMPGLGELLQRHLA